METSSRRGEARETLRDVLSRLRRDRGWDERLQAEAAVAAWASVVGADVARHTMALRVRGGILQVAVRHQTWATQLCFLRSDIVRRLRTACGAGVRDIVFTVDWPAWAVEGGTSEGGVGPVPLPALLGAAQDARGRGAARASVSTRGDDPGDLQLAFARWRRTGEQRQASPGLRRARPPF